jgi:hypothetical protein
MTTSPVRARVIPCAVTASVLLLASCSSVEDADPRASPTPGPTATATTTATAAAGASGASEKELTERLEAALAGFHSGRMVESGVERVSDGIHTEPLLTKGGTYRLNLACAGTGSARLRLTPAGAAERTDVPCDGSVRRQRITADAPIRIDVDGVAGATGMIAWQIDEV